MGEPASRRLLLVRGDRAADLTGERVIACRDLLGDLHPRAGLQLVAEFNVHGGRVRGARGKGQGARGEGKVAQVPEALALTFFASDEAMRWISAARPRIATISSARK